MIRIREETSSGFIVLYVKEDEVEKEEEVFQCRNVVYLFDPFLNVFKFRVGTGDTWRELRSRDSIILDLRQVLEKYSKRKLRGICD